MASESKEDDLISEFECPICNEYMHPPIRMCQTGHSFCDSCFNKIITCSICKFQKGGGRNFPLEKLYEKLKFPCKYQENGCTTKHKGSELCEHAKQCYFRNIACPTDLDCPWTGTIKSLEEHYLTTENHKEFQVRKSSIFTYTADMKSQAGSTTVDKVHNELFVVQRFQKDNCMSWNVYHFGSVLKTERYTFRIVIGNRIELRAPCEWNYKYK